MRSKSILGLLLLMLFTIIPSKNLYAEVIPAYNVTTNMTHYSTYFESYPVSNVIDGNKSQKFWSNSNQAAGQYITVELNEDAPRIGIINLYFQNGDKPASAKLQLSNTNTDSDWVDLISFTSDDIVNNVLSCDAQGVTAKYVRLLLTASANVWLQVSEIEINRNILSPRTISAYPSSSNYGSVFINGESVSTIEN